MTETLSDHRKVFWYFLTLAILWHILWFLVLPHWPQSESARRVEIQPYSTKQLDQIRDQWKEREKSLLIQKNPNAPRAKEASKDARYYSDRNTVVEKETQAKITNVVPKTGSQIEQKASPQIAAKPKSESARTNSHPLKLGNLGVKMNFEKAPDQTQEEQKESQMQNPSERGGDQALLDHQAPIGAENMLNTAESRYYSFYSRIYEEIGPLWQSYIREIPYQQRVAKGEYTTVADVVFDSQGNISEVKILRSSGVAGFDQAVLRAWKKLERFPNPPKSLLGADGFGHTGWTFSVAVGEGFNVDYAPPSREY